VEATSRVYRGHEDFEAMGRIVSESWRIGGPLVSCTVGDLEWWTVNDPDQSLVGRVRIWLLDGRPVGWEWPDPPSASDWHLQPGVARARFLDPMLDRLEQLALAARAAGGTGVHVTTGGRREIRAVTATTTWAMDGDAEAIEILSRRGYKPDGLALSHWVRALPAAGGEALPEPPLPTGYRHATVTWPDDVPARVEVHRSAFAPSRMTVEKYRLLVDLPHYAPERDRVVVAPDGSFAAFANAWYDPEARVGELEPVGTHADHRRLGLARAGCFVAMRALEAAGARQVLIFSGQANVAAEALYESLGCTLATTSRRYARPLDT
jgi:ribosomal protein S18 acetylase RimI-like enzyme